MGPNPSETMTAGERWSIEAAEALIGSLNGVLSTRIVARPGGEIDEIHVLTSEEVSPKQTVRNVESALLAHFELGVDHRKISVAQTSRPIPLGPRHQGSLSVVAEVEPAPREARVLFKGHRLETEDGHRIRARVAVEWDGKVHEGVSSAPDLPRNRLEATAEATLTAMEAVAGGDSTDELSGFSFPSVSLSLDGVKVIEAFDNRFVLVSVNAMGGRDVITLSGTASVGRSLERAVVLATLKATDRWVRGRLD